MILHPYFEGLRYPRRGGIPRVCDRVARRRCLVLPASEKGDLGMIDRANVLLVTLFVDGFTRVRDRLRREEGQAFVEYAMVLLLVTVVLAAGAFKIGRASCRERGW